MASKIKIAVIGIGNVATSHLADISTLEGYELTAVCGTSLEKVRPIAEKYQVAGYDDFRKLFQDKVAELILIATPHGTHAEMAIAAFETGHHVLVEKPIASNVEDARKSIEAWKLKKKEIPKLLFAGMFQFRIHPAINKIRDMILGGELGRLTRVTWTITNWFRTQAYFESAAWRGTWKGEGGGVLINQNSHALDTYQWLFGMPKQLLALCSQGKFHDIEVEDEATVFFKHENGMIGHLITSTAEFPGVNRLEIAGEFGLLTFEDNQIRFQRNPQSALELIKTSEKSFAPMKATTEEITYPTTTSSGHRQMLDNVAKTLIGESELIVGAEEGYHSLELINASILSSQEKAWINLPIDPKRYSALIAQLSHESKFKKAAPRATNSSGSFADSFAL